MSRKARTPIVIPKGVEVKCEKDCVTVKGPKGTLQRQMRPGINLEIEESQLKVTLKENHSSEKNMLGLYWALISNMVTGVTQEFEKTLEMIGVGYRASVQGSLLDILAGFSHPTKMPIPEGLTVKVEKNTLITIKGVDKQLVGQFAANIRAKRPPEPYKGKGIRYKDEYVRRKAGKAGKK